MELDYSVSGRVMTSRSKVFDALCEFVARDYSHEYERAVDVLWGDLRARRAELVGEADEIAEEWSVPYLFHEHRLSDGTRISERFIEQGHELLDEHAEVWLRTAAGKEPRLYEVMSSVDPYQLRLKDVLTAQERMVVVPLDAPFRLTGSGLVARVLNFGDDAWLMDGEPLPISPLVFARVRDLYVEAAGEVGASTWFFRLWVRWIIDRTALVAELGGGVVPLPTGRAVELEIPPILMEVDVAEARTDWWYEEWARTPLAALDGESPDPAVYFGKGARVTELAWALQGVYEASLRTLTPLASPHRLWDRFPLTRSFERAPVQLPAHYLAEHEWPGLAAATEALSDRLAQVSDERRCTDEDIADDLGMRRIFQDHPGLRDAMGPALRWMVDFDLYGRLMQPVTAAAWPARRAPDAFALPGRVCAFFLVDRDSLSSVERHLAGTDHPAAGRLLRLVTAFVAREGEGLRVGALVTPHATELSFVELDLPGEDLGDLPRDEPLPRLAQVFATVIHDYGDDWMKMPRLTTILPRPSDG